METGIQTINLARDTVWVSDTNIAMIDAQRKFEYDAVYIDVGNDWRQKKEFILTIRNRYPIVPFVLMGSRSSFLEALDEKERQIYQQYFFFDFNVPIARALATITDTLGQVEWDIRTRFGEKIDFDRRNENS